MGYTIQKSGQMVLKGVIWVQNTKIRSTQMVLKGVKCVNNDKFGQMVLKGVNWVLYAKQTIIFKIS